MASHKRTAAAACAVFLASVSLYPFFAGMVWLWAGVGAILAVALAGTAARRRPLPVPVMFLTGLLALLLYLNLVFSNARSLLHLLPTPASLAALWETAGRGFAETAQYAPPVPELRGMVLIAAAGIGISALLTDLIAVTLGSAALAGLPLLLLFTEPFALSVARGFAGTTVAFCLGVIGYLALLSSEGKERIREWERPAPAAREEPDTRALAAAGRRVGFASVVLALCLPLFIPGLHVTRLFGGGQAGIGGSGGSGAGVGFPDPGTQVSSELHTAQASTVLTYTSTSSIPDYLQIYALDRLTANAGWQLFSQPESLVTVSPRLPAVPGLTATSDSATITTQVTVAPGVGGDDLGALPVPYPPTSVTAAGTAVRADQATLMVFDSGSLGGLKYTVTSRSEVPSSQLLNTAAPPPASITTPDMYVPGSYDFLLPLAETVVRAAGAKTKFQEAVALQNWLAGGSFAYTLKAPSVLNATELANFLEVTRKGYCQQFSFAMAVLSRLLGIPSRVAYGFTSGTLESSGAWLVTTHDAHAWPELYFQGYGWLRFEPTPSGSDGQGTAYAPAYATSQTGGISSGPAPTAAAGQSAAAIGGDQGASLPPNIAERNRQGTTGAATRASGAGALDPWQVAGLVLAGLVVLAAVAPWCARRVIRRRRWRRARPGPAAVDRVRARDVAWAHAAWNELRDDLTDHGQAWRPSETPRALAARTGASLSLAEPARSALTRIALAEERARYAPTPAEGAGLRADSVTLRRAIAAAAPRRRRWQARLLPASVLVPALGAIAAGADLYRGARLSRRAWGYRGPRKVR